MTINYLHRIKTVEENDEGNYFSFTFELDLANSTLRGKSISGSN
jgi:hypothetical protein